MCTLAIFTRLLPDLPLVVAANRDEVYGRPASGPVLLGEGPRLVGGLDLVAGGSWLVVAEHGLVVGVLNRRTAEALDPSRESRGRLCLELARMGSVGEAAARLRALEPERHNAFNVLVASRGEALVAQNRPGGTVVQELAPGTHVLTNLDLNDATCPRISRSARRFADVADRHLAHADASALVSGLHGVLADHQTALDDRLPTDQICIHAPAGGTRSSAIVLVSQGGEMRFLHAHGPPCRSAYRRVELPWGVA